MAKLEDLTMKVNVNISVSDETIETCLRLITIWLNEDPRRAIRGGERHDDGKIEPLKIDKSNWRADDDQRR